METFETVVIGAGIMGLAASCELARRGSDVLLIDQATIPNPQSASFDYSKVFRLAYPDPVYVRLASEAFPLWRELERQTGSRILTSAGILLLGSEASSLEAEAYSVLRSLGLDAELLASREAAARFPHFNPDAFTVALFDPAGAILHADTALQALADLALRRGVKLAERERITELDEDGHHIRLETESGRSIAGRKVLVATGPWTRNLLPQIALLRTTRQETVYFSPQWLSDSGRANRAGDAANTMSFEPGAFPIFAALETGFYGFPVHHQGAMKISNHNKGEPVDPRAIAHPVSDGFIGGCREFFGKFIPSLADARVTGTRVCIYNNTPDDDFIIDWHPRLKNTLIATGFSGHGFKFAPVVGAIAADLLTTGSSIYSIERFGLGRFG